MGVLLKTGTVQHGGSKWALFGVRQAWVSISYWPLNSCMIWANHFTSLNLSFLICKVEIIPTSYDKDEMIVERIT